MHERYFSCHILYIFPFFSQMLFNSCAPLSVECSTRSSYDFVLTRASSRSIWFGWLGITPVSAYIALGSCYQAGLETCNDPVISGLLGQLG